MKSPFMLISTFALKLCDVGRRRAEARGSTKTSNKAHRGTGTCLHLQIPLSPPLHHDPRVLLAPGPPRQTSSSPPSPAFPTRGRPIRPDPVFRTRARRAAAAPAFPRAPGSRGITFNLKLLAGRFAPGSASKKKNKVFPVLQTLHIFSFVFLGFRPSCTQPSILRPCESSSGPLWFPRVSSGLKVRSRGHRTAMNPCVLREMGQGSRGYMGWRLRAEEGRAPLHVPHRSTCRQPDSSPSPLLTPVLPESRDPCTLLPILHRAGTTRGSWQLASKS